MKKVIGINAGNTPIKWDYETYKEKGLGGSETWAIELAHQFALHGFYVIVFGQPNQHYIDEFGVEFVPVSSYASRIQCQHFDYFISSRHVDPIVQELGCDNIYVMIHDLQVLHADNLKLLSKSLRIKKYIALSEFHKNLLELIYKGTIVNDNVKVIPNGVNKTLYQDVNKVTKLNQMVWSSRTERGLLPFTKYILPLVLKEVPDFKILVTQYEGASADTNDYSTIKGVKLLPPSNKSKLAEYQMQSKIWVAPAIYNETFCISAVENAFAKNAILAMDNGALKDTLNGYSNTMYNSWKSDTSLDYSFDEEEYKFRAPEIAKEIIKMLTDNNYRETLANEAYNICKDYTWENVCNMWLREFYPEAY